MPHSIAPARGASASPWAGRLLAVWHGYRAQGQRIVLTTVNALVQRVPPRHAFHGGSRVLKIGDRVKPVLEALAAFDAKGNEMLRRFEQTYAGKTLP